MVDISQVSLIPRQVLFGNPDKAMARLSPDGRQLAYLAPVNGVLNVWVGPSDKPDKMKPVTDDSGRGVRFYAWSYTNEHILYIQDKGGDENWHLYSVTLSTGEIKNLTPFEGVQAQVQAASLETPNEIIVGLNDRDPQLHDLYRINITTGERQLIQQNEGFMSFVLDEGYRVRYANRMRPDGGFDMLKVTGDGEWSMFMEVPGEDLLTTNVIGFNRAGDTLYMTASKDRDTAALYTVDPETGERTLLAEDARSDAGDVMIHPTQKRIQAVAFNYERKEWRLLDEAIEKDISFLKTVASGEVEIVSRTLDDQTWLAAYLMDDGPVRYYRYSRREMAAEFLFTDRQALENQPLAKMHSTVIRSRDGLDLVSYYTLPPGSDNTGDGRPDQPLPLVLFVHGGPWARDQWGYNPFHQWLANRGYAVLAVNFRGSTGFGKAFVNAGNLEWAAAMHDDLLDGVAWAIEQGIADPDRVAIAGGSYGGYATLVGMTLTPETFACGVDIVGPSNLITLLESIPPYWAPMVELFTNRVGDFRVEEGRALLQERSPLTHVNRIKRPLLIGQGANDPRVKQAEADQIVEAMREKEIPVTYVLYPDEGHGFARPENNMSFAAVAEAFIAPILGGRFEPIGSDFEGSSISVPAGAEEVPGLPAVLPDGD